MRTHWHYRRETTAVGPRRAPAKFAEQQQQQQRSRGATCKTNFEMHDSGGRTDGWTKGTNCQENEPEKERKPDGEEK